MGAMLRNRQCGSPSSIDRAGVDETQSGTETARVAVVIPVYNEVRTVSTVLRRVLANRATQEVIVVDDGSNDGTDLAVLQNAKRDERVKVIHHQRNRGKGAALRTAFKHVSAPIVILQDADLEYDPSDYERVIAPIVLGYSCVSFGSRFMNGSLTKISLVRRKANKILTRLSNAATGLSLTDMETCMKAFRTEVISGVCIEEDGFGVEPEITAKCASLGLRICEIPISYVARSKVDGKKLRWLDGVDAMKCILKYHPQFIHLRRKSIDLEHRKLVMAVSIQTAVTVVTKMLLALLKQKS